VFAPKFRRKILYSQKREVVGKILRKLCEWNDVEIIEAEVCPDHVHMLVAIPPKLSVSSFMGYLKGKSSLELFDIIPELKKRCRNWVFWCRGYYVDTAGKNADRIKAYIQQQLEEDKLGEQQTMFDK
jgi:putative transposase